MTRHIACLVPAMAVVVAGCASYPAPVQRLADAEASSRGAAEVGASASPQAQLHLTMAQEEIAHAKRLMNDGDNKKADFVLLRARADAELSLAFAREAEAETAAAKALGKVSAMNQPATSVTTTTSATTTTTPGDQP